MCRFLLQNGADVDHFAPFPRSPFVSGNILTVLYCTSYSRYKQARDWFSECQTLLLNAGCDPTVPLVGQDGQFLEGLAAFILLASLVNIVPALATRLKDTNIEMH